MFVESLIAGMELGEGEGWCREHGDGGDGGEGGDGAEGMG